MNIIPLKAEHCMMIGELVPVHSSFEMTPEMAVDLEEIGGYTVLKGTRVLGVGGIMQHWRGVGMAWAWLSRDWRGEARAITEAAVRHLDASPLRRVETAVKCGFAPGQRWAERLGFALETPCARKWGPDGEDYSIWVRIR